MILGIDVDDVLYPCATTMHDICLKAGITNGEDYKTWALHEDYGVDRIVVERTLAPAISDGSLYRKPPYPGAVAALERLAKKHTIILVTARGFGLFQGPTKAVTAEWLRNYRVPHHGLAFTTDKTLINADIFIDDALHNYDALVKAGKRCYLMNRPHNHIDGDFERFRVDSLEEFEQIVEVSSWVA